MLNEANEVIRSLLEAMKMQEGREKEELHIPQLTAWVIWSEVKEKAEDFLSQQKDIKHGEH